MRPADLPLSELLPKLRNDSLALEEYYHDVLDRVEERDGVVLALLPEDGRRQRLLDAAQSLRKRYGPGTRPLLYGALFGVKDIFKIDGFPMRAGSRLPVEAFEGPQAAIVSELLSLGAVPLGRTVTTEFAYFSPGPTTNPRNPGHTPGGSSSGSAAAVGAGYCRFALGTQTIGSVIRPAAFCGIGGIKPSYDRLSRRGVFPFSDSADHVGFLLGSIEDGSVLLGSLLDGNAWRTGAQGESMDLRAVSLALPDDAYLSQVDPPMARHFEAVLRRLKEAGVTLRESSALSGIKDIARTHRAMIAREFYEAHRSLFERYGELYSEASTKLYREGEHVSPTETAVAREGRQQLRRSLDEELASLGCRGWISPSSFGTAPKGLESTGSPAMNLPWTYAGLPTVNVPSGTDEEGLPFGLQLAGPFGADRSTLALGAELATLF